MQVTKALCSVIVMVIIIGVLLGGIGCAKQPVGIDSIQGNDNGTFTIYLSDGTSFTSGDLTGPGGEKGDKGDKGDTGSQGPQGMQGLTGTMPVLGWHMVTSFTGSGDQVTAPYYVPMDDSRLTIFAEADTADAFLYISVESQDGGVPVELIDMDISNTISADVEYVRQGRGYYYLDVIAYGLTEWSVYVEAMY